MKGKGRVSDRLIAGLGLYMEIVGRGFWGPRDVRESRLMNKYISPLYSTHDERKKLIYGCSSTQKIFTTYKHQTKGKLIIIMHHQPTFN